MTGVPEDLITRARLTPIEDVIRKCGLKLKGRNECVGPCPKCGGTDRFGVNRIKQVFNCRGCGAKGGVIALLMLADKCDFRTAVERLSGERVDGNRPRQTRPAAKASSDEETRLKLALEIFGEAIDAHGTEAEAYLRARRLELPPGADAIRFHPRCIFGGERVPSMVALFRHNITDKPLGIQRTRLPSGGWVRGMKMERKNLGPTGGGSIKVDEDADVLYGLTIGEGLETVLAGRMLGYRPAWATGGKGTLKNFPLLPEPVQSLSAHWEPDAADDVSQCLDRWRDSGRETIVLKSLFGKDAADALWEGDP